MQAGWRQSSSEEPFYDFEARYKGSQWSTLSYGFVNYLLDSPAVAYLFDSVMRYEILLDECFIVRTRALVVEKLLTIRTAHDSCTCKTYNK